MSFTVPIDCQCLAVGVAAVPILLSGLIDLKIIIKNTAGQLLYNLLFLCLSNSILYHCEQKKKWEKIVACYRHKSKWWFKGKVIHVCWRGHVVTSAWNWIMALDCLLESQYVLPVSLTCKGKGMSGGEGLPSIHNLHPEQQLVLPLQKQRWLPGSAACLPLSSFSSFLCPSVSPICIWNVQKIPNLGIKLGHLILIHCNDTAGFVRIALLGVSSQLLPGSMFHPVRSTKTVPKCQAAPLQISGKERINHLCILQCADPGPAVPKILPMLLTESAVTEDTTIQTLLTQACSLKHRNTDARCVLKKSKGKAERDRFALVLRWNVLLSKIGAFRQGSEQACIILGTFLPLRHQLLHVY